MFPSHDSRVVSQSRYQLVLFPSHDKVPCFTVTIYELVTEYYYRCEYRSFETGGYITEGNKWYSSEMLTERLRKDPWGRNFICFPYHTDNKHTVNGLTYKFEPVYKHNRTAIVGYLISTSIDRKIIWCVDMFRTEVI